MHQFRELFRVGEIMAGATQYYEALCLNILRSTTGTGFAAYVGLFTVAPTDSTGGTEASGGNYARQLCGFGAPAGTPRSMNNASIVTFGTVTWSGTIVAWGIFDAATVGNLTHWYDCPDQVVASGNIVQFAANALIVQVD
jgi:hypothetical protein